MKLNDLKMQFELNKLKHFLVTVDHGGNIVHLCGYESPPKKQDEEHLIEELKTDPDFGLTDKMDKCFTFNPDVLPQPAKTEMYKTIYKILGRTAH